MKKTKKGLPKRILALALTFFLMASMVPNVTLTAFAEDVQREFPYPGLSCQLKGKDATQLNALLTAAGYDGLTENSVSGTDYNTGGECDWQFVGCDSSACKWDCKTHFANTTVQENGETKPVYMWQGFAFGHSGNYCGYCKWTDHEHEWSTDWEKDDTHHWHPCTEDCFIEDFASCEESAYTAHTDGDDDGNCDVCGKHFVHIGQEEWEKDDTNHWHKCTGEGCLAKVDEASHNWGIDGICACGAELTVVDVSYVYRSWNGSKVGSESRTAEGCIVVTGFTTTLENGKWYVVNENVTVNGRINVNGTAHLILSDGKTLTARAGIHTGQGQTLNIYGQQNDSGALIATGIEDSAGIGGGKSEAGGTICIYGGTVTANGSQAGAGIGGGNNGPGGTTYIYGGTVTAKGGQNGAGIGAGYGKAGGTTTINGGTVTATSEKGAGIGGGLFGMEGGTTTINGGTVTATSNDGAGIGSGYFGTAGGTTTINGGTVTATGYDGAGIGSGRNGAAGGTTTINGGTVTATSNTGAGIGSGRSGKAGGTTTINGGTVTATSIHAAGIGGGQYGSAANVTLGNGVTLLYGAYNYSATGWVTKDSSNIGATLHGANFAKTGTPGVVSAAYVERSWNGRVVSETKTAEACIPITSSTTTLENGKWYVVNENVTVNGRITVNGTAHLILADGFTLTAKGGIDVSEGNMLNIYGQSGDTGKLEAMISGWNAGIGGRDEYNSGTVNIHGGTVEASSTAGAGIGGGFSGKGGKVTIYGGTVTATSEDGAGIGGGYYNGSGIITINGGTVKATGTQYGAGIGGGGEGNGGEITINGGTVTATGTEYGAGIGGGWTGNGGKVTINGGTVTATSEDGAGIGGGFDGSSATVTLGKGVALRYGWDDASATSWLKHGDSDIGATLNSVSFAKTGTPPSPHQFTFHIPDDAKNTLVATCSEGTGCNLPGGTLTLTLSADSGQYNGTAYTASHDNEDVDFVNITESQIGDVAYYSGVMQMLNAPTNPGTYTAKLTVTTEDGTEYTLEKEFTISKATLDAAKYTAPTAKDNLAYSGSAQQLIIAGSVIGGKMYYSADYNPETKAGTWVTAVSSITGTNAGSYTVYYKVVGDALHADVEPILISNTAIAKKQITVSGIKAENKTYDGTTDAGLVYTDAAFGGKVEGDTLTVTASGSFADANVGTGKTVSVSNLVLGGASKDNYVLAVSGNQTSTTANITAKDINVTITPNGGTYAGTITAASAVLNDLVEGDTTTQAALTYTNQEGTGYYNSTTVPTNAGAYTVTATVSNTNYNLTGTTTADFVIAKAEVTAPAADTTVFTYNKAEQTYTVAGNTLYTVSGNKRTVAGSQTVTVALKDKANYVWTDTKTAEDKTFTFTINKAAANLSVALTFSKTYGDADFSLGATKDSNATVSYAVKDGDAVTVDTTGKVTIAKAGTATITVSVPANDNYLADSKDITVTVAQKQGTLTITNVTYEVTYGDADFTIGEITSEGDEGSAITFTGYDDKVISVDETGKVTIVGAGETTVKVNRENGANYLAAVEVPVTVKVNPKPATVTPADKSVTYGDAQAELTYTNTTLVGEDTLNVKLTKAGGEDVGEYEITASQEENANPNYNLTFEKGKYTIAKRSITGAEITLDNVLVANDDTQTQNIKSVTVTVGEGADAKKLDVTYDVTGNTGKDAGSYTLTVTANGNFEGTAAKTFVILPAPASNPTTNPDGSVKIGGGSIDVEAKGVTLNTDKASVIASVPGNVLTADVLSEVAGGYNVDIVLNAKEFTPGETDKELVAKKLGRYKVGEYLDVNLNLLVNGVFSSYITELNAPISVSVKLPDSLINTNGDYQRTYAVIRVHGGEAEVLDATFNASTKMLTFKTDRFSTYSVVYKDTWNPKTGDTKTTILWAGVMLLGLMAIGAGIALPNKKRYTGKYRR